MKAGVLATSYSKIGGARHIFSNDTSLHVLLVGCNVPVERMPTVGNKLPAEFKVIPNAILPYDVDTIPGATLYPFNGAWMVTSEILEKRIPPVASAIKKAMKDDESYPCVFRYTLYN